MSEPTTEAGKRLVADVESSAMPAVMAAAFRDIAVRIEAEARADLDVVRLARAIQYIETPVGAQFPPIDTFLDRAAALAAAYREAR